MKFYVILVIKDTEYDYNMVVGHKRSAIVMPANIIRSLSHNEMH